MDKKKVYEVPYASIVDCDNCDILTVSSGAFGTDFDYPGDGWSD